MTVRTLCFLFWQSKSNDSDWQLSIESSDGSVAVWWMRSIIHYFSEWHNISVPRRLDLRRQSISCEKRAHAARIYQSFVARTTDGSLDVETSATPTRQFCTHNKRVEPIAKCTPRHSTGLRHPFDWLCPVGHCSFAVNENNTPHCVLVSYIWV